MYNIAICDDEIKVLELLEDTIKEKFNDLKLECNYIKTTNPEELLTILDNGNIDVLFLDIDMPIISGMDIGEYLLNKGDEGTRLVFVTNHDALVYKSFKYHPFSFIRKSHLEEEIGTVINSISKNLERMKDTIVIRVNNELVKVKIEDILYFEAEANYINLYGRKENYKFRDTLANLEKILSNRGFIRVHKGYLISQKEVYLVKSKELKLIDGTLIPIGRSYSDAARKELMKYMRL